MSTGMSTTIVVSLTPMVAMTTISNNLNFILEDYVHGEGETSSNTLASMLEMALLIP